MKGLICENCGEVLALDGRNGSASNGEDAAWLVIEAGRGSGMLVDACSRSCAVELLSDDGPLRAHIDAMLEMCSAISRAVNDDDEDDEDE